jgi:hypothetical protein
MRRRYAVLVGVALGLVGSVAGFAAVAQSGPGADRVDRRVGPRVAEDLGAGEVLIAVVGGVYPTRKEAEAANGRMSFGDLQGYYVVPVAQFQGLREQLGQPGDFALVSMFRTEEGAAEFVEMARAFGQPATILPTRVHSFGGVYAGLGQESDPDGTGPLLGPIPESLPQAEPTPAPTPVPTISPEPSP